MRWNFVMFTIISIFSSDIRIMSFFLNIYAKQLIWDSIYHLQVFWIILYTQKHYLDLIIDCYTCRRIPELCWLWYYLIAFNGCIYSPVSLYFHRKNIYFTSRQTDSSMVWSILFITFSQKYLFKKSIISCIIYHF